MLGIKYRNKFILQHVQRSNHKAMMEQKRSRGKGIISIHTCTKLLWQQVCDKKSKFFFWGGVLYRNQFIPSELALPRIYLECKQIEIIVAVVIIKLQAILLRTFTT